MDFDLAQEPFETVRLMYRPSPDTEWEVYEDVNITPFGSGGLARMDPILPGDYALANYYVEVSTDNILADASISVSPNPVMNMARINIDFADAESDYELQLFDLQGRLLRSEVLGAAPQVQTDWSLADLPAGTYVLNVVSGMGFRALEIVKQ